MVLQIAADKSGVGKEQQRKRQQQRDPPGEDGLQGLAEETGGARRVIPSGSRSAPTEPPAMVGRAGVPHRRLDRGRGRLAAAARKDEGRKDERVTEKRKEGIGEVNRDNHRKFYKQI